MWGPEVLTWPPLAASAYQLFSAPPGSTEPRWPPRPTKNIRRGQQQYSLWCWRGYHYSVLEGSEKLGNACGQICVVLSSPVQGTRGTSNIASVPGGTFSMPVMGCGWMRCSHRSQSNSCGWQKQTVHRNYCMFVYKLSLFFIFLYRQWWGVISCCVLLLRNHTGVLTLLVCCIMLQSPHPYALFGFCGGSVTAGMS